MYFDNGAKMCEYPVENTGWESGQIGERGGKTSQDSPESF